MEMPSGAKVFFQRGVNFTAEYPARYGSEQSLAMLRRLPEFGINAVALVPYGFSPRGAPRVRFRRGGEGMESDIGIERLADVAHQRGIHVMLKPQLWTGGSGFPGSIDFPSTADRAAWFVEYRAFLEHQAELAARIHADVFCIGVEFALLSKHDAEWRALIERARRIYKGPLTYGATQGPEFEGIRFWDALDYIGLNNYYPLSDDLSCADVVQRVEAVQKRYGRPVIFPEAGFCSFDAPHRAPWDETPRKLSLEAQARCYDAVLKAFYRKPWFQGVYWWKVGTTGFGGPSDGSHTPWGKPAIQVMARWYRSGWR